MVKIVGDGMRRIVRPDSSESFGMGRDEYLAGIWRISGIGDESLFLLYKRVGAECVDVHLHKRHEIEKDMCLAADAGRCREVYRRPANKSVMDVEGPP